MLEQIAYFMLSLSSCVVLVLGWKSILESDKIDRDIKETNHKYGFK